MQEALSRGGGECAGFVERNTTAAAKQKKGSDLLKRSKKEKTIHYAELRKTALARHREAADKEGGQQKKRVRKLGTNKKQEKRTRRRV